MKLFYRIKGKYPDGRNRLVIEDKDSGTNQTLPKPEEMKKILDTLKSAKIKQEIETPSTTILREP